MTEPTGLFWAAALDDLKTKRAAKPKPVKELPHPFWLADDYLPGLDDAIAEVGIRRLSPGDWMALKRMRDRGEDVELVWDTECYHDLWAFGIRVRKGGPFAGMVDWIELSPDVPVYDHVKSKWIVQNFPLRGFNSEKYDATMLALAHAGCDNEVLKIASDDMIQNNKYHMEVLRQYRASRVKFADHVDMMDIPAGILGLKTYAARLGAKTLQDLPFPPDVVLGRNRRKIVLYYMNNDGVLTEVLANRLEPEIKLREQMSERYGLDLRNASDPKIAETVLRVEYERKTGATAFKPKIPVGTAYQYNVPDYMQFRTKLLRDTLDIIRDTWFIVGKDGAVELPKELDGLKLPIGGSVYTLGIGGLHSTEAKRAIGPAEDEEMCDADVASYYPAIIRNQRLYPKHLGPEFLEVYGVIVDTRLAAKAAKDKTTADSLKIVINSSFGKFGNKHSVLYSPDFLFQTTLSGQLSLLMLIEAIELAGMRVVSANTDGIVVLCKKTQTAERDAIFDWWQKHCSFELEYSYYKMLASASVNSYYAVSIEKDGKLKCKRKGIYADLSISTTPGGNVSADAVEQYLLNGTPVEEYIRGCTDMRKFVIVRNVSGGGLWRDWYLGKTCRWYWSNAADADRIIYVKSGNKVAGSDNCRPMPVLTDTLPPDVCIDTYIQKAYDILADIGITQEQYA